jgi:hypothetical protein
LHSFEHLLPQLFLGDFLHGSGDKLQVRVIGDLKLNLVPDVGKKWPRIIINELIEYFFIL